MTEQVRKIDFKTLPYDLIGSDTNVSDIYAELDLEGDASLCLGLVVAELPRRKVLRFYFATFSPSFGDMKYLGFDIRELFGVESIDLPLKGEDKLEKVCELLEAKFSSSNELLTAILSTKSEPIQLYSAREI